MIGIIASCLITTCSMILVVSGFVLSLPSLFNAQENLVLKINLLFYEQGIDSSLVHCDLSLPAVSS